MRPGFSYFFDTGQLLHHFWSCLVLVPAHIRTLSCSAILSHHFPPKEDWACLRQGPRPLRDVNGLHLGSESAEVMTTVIRDRCPPKKDSSRPLKVAVSLSLSEFCTVVHLHFCKLHPKTFFGVVWFVRWIALSVSCNDWQVEGQPRGCPKHIALLCFYNNKQINIQM